MTPVRSDKTGSEIVTRQANARERDSLLDRITSHYQLIVIVVAALIYLVCALSPPSLMDDVDSVQASISRSMLKTGDWVTPRLDGIKYFEKPPLKYWLMAAAFKVFGDSDISARLPMTIFAILLCWLTARMTAWAFGKRTGLLAGLLLATSLGLFLFTRVLISDVALTFTIALAIWAFLRALDKDETRPRLWALIFGASVGVGVLFKGLIAALFPIGTAFLYLIFTGQLSNRETWWRLIPIRSALLALAIAAPWHILATLRNPPYFYVSFHSGPGAYHGLFWFYFFNEHILRFLNRRYPHDYNTVPRVWFWLLHFAWFFPWSIYLAGTFKLRYRGSDRASRTKLMSLCWIGFVMLFFSFSSTQEYYSMPCYPAIAVLIACAMVWTDSWVVRARRIGENVLGGICALAVGIIGFLLARVWNLATPGDISQALFVRPEAYYTLSMGHMGDLTVSSLAYLRPPLVLAGIACLAGLSVLWLKPSRRFIGPVVMMVLFFNVARLAMITFDPYLSSRPLANALLHTPHSRLIVDNQYYTFASVFYYANTKALLLNGRVNNLEYGSNAPDAPHVFITDADLPSLWQQDQRWYLLVEKARLQPIENLLGAGRVFVIRESGGKYLVTNKPVTGEG
ncbi:MAG: glycosyltransferase family 39 protein [Bryobacteraceae bacterium]